MSTAATNDLPTIGESDPPEIVARLVWESINDSRFDYFRALPYAWLKHRVDLAHLEPLFKHIVYGKGGDRRSRAVEAMESHPGHLAAFLAVEESSAGQAKATDGRKASGSARTGRPKGEAGAKRGQHLDDRASARLALKAADGIAIPDEQLAQLDPNWQDLCLVIRTDGPDDWLARMKLVVPDRFEAYRDALDAARLEPEPDDEPDDAPGDDAGDPGEDWIESGDIATLADVEAELGAAQFLWDGWIQFGALTAVIAEGGTGKTRTVAEWAARLWHGHPMPDGSVNPLPAGTKTLWLCYDRNWRGLIKTAREFGLPPEAILLPTHRKKPLWIPDFDDPKTIAILGAIIRKHKPGFVSIDTTTYATAFNTAKANETKLAFDPLMNLMVETMTACIALTHTNAQGEILNRRLRERVRTEIKISRPAPEQKNRLRLEVRKTEDKFPPPLGMTFRDDGIDYDDNPPTEPEPGQRGPKPEKSVGLAEWLWGYLQSGAAPMVEIIDAARDEGKLKRPTADNPKPSISSLYDARKRIPRLHPGKVIDEFTAPSPKGKPLVHWQIIEDPDEGAALGPEGDMPDGAQEVDL